ncbi:MAG: hypothetical protein RL219_1693 [Actinomycetota bacterium]
MSDNTLSSPISRRTLVKGGLGGLVVGLFLNEGTGLPRALDAVLPGSSSASALGSGTQVNTWLHIGTDETVTLTVGASEMGQGSFSTLAQVLAEELYVDYDLVSVVQGQPSLVSPAPIGCSISTVGSSVTRSNFWKMRDAAAIAREMLVSAAMTRHGDTVRANYTVSNGVIRHTSGTSFTYGTVAEAAARLTPPASAPLVPDAEFRYIGKTVKRKDLPAKVNGSAVFGLDVRLPGMVYAIVKHSPSFGGTLKVLPATPTGMLRVVPLKVWTGTGRGLEADGNVNAVAVVGPDTWTTWQATKRLSVSWNPPVGVSTLNSAQFTANSRALLTGGTPYVSGGANPPGTVYTVEGNASDAARALSGAAKQVDAVYSLPYVAHATMEVLNCTVDYVPGVKCDIYAPTQGGKTTHSLAVAMTGLAPSAVRVNTTMLGGGLGRKWEQDFVSQAIQVAMAIGKPVKLMWPREEDFAHDQYRPAALIAAKAGLDANNNVVGWSYRVVSQSLGQQRGSTLGPTGDGQGHEGASHLPYALGTVSTEFVSDTARIPVGYWRSVGASLNTFAVECQIDELATLAGEDPYLFRRSRISDPRWLAVLDAVAQASNWSSPAPSGRARGIAIGAAFNSIVAQVVEAHINTTTSSTGVVTKTIAIDRVWVAIDSYLAVNPGQVEHQIIGGVIHGINAALYGRQTFSAGAAQSNNFRNNRMIRPKEAPMVTVVRVPNPAQLDRTKTIGGVGELGVPTLVPALANAYFRLTGTRQRSLPFYPTSTMSGL